MLLLSGMLSLVLCSALAGLQHRQAAQRRERSACLYQTCHATKPGLLNVHIVSHTHDDLGWVHTVDFYYDHYVRTILDSVVRELQANPERRFTYVEMGFFSRWWDDQSADTRQLVRELVDAGRLEFTSGGWSMNDEATTHYSATVDEMTLGMRWLNDTLGQCARPRVAWQIDPFGHAREEAALFGMMGFDGQFLGRIHLDDKKWRQDNKLMEFLWRANKYLGEKGDLFTGVLPNVYWPPHGFCFDMYCADETVREFNGPRRAKEFIEIVTQQAKYYATNHTVVTMGMDFHYKDAAKWFDSLDNLIYYVNALQQSEGSPVHVLYSTPACYLKALHESSRRWPEYDDDFFPYADSEHAYWTGYYSSRPNFKFFARKANGFLQACKQLKVIGNVIDGDTETLSRAVGVMQHHDAISGTEKQHVVEDYAHMTYLGIRQCEAVVSRAYRKLLFPPGFSAALNLSFCPLLNLSSCPITESADEFLMFAYNPLSTAVATYARFPVSGDGYEVWKLPGTLVEAQMVPVSEKVLRIPERGARSKSRKEIVFPISLPPLGVTTYLLKKYAGYLPRDSEDSAVYNGGSEAPAIDNGKYRLFVDPVTGLLERVLVLSTSQEIPFRQSIFMYRAYEGLSEKPSGAYSFNPATEEPLDLGGSVNYSLVKGPLVQEIHQSFSRWVSQVIRLYKDQDLIEFEWVVGPIPFYDTRGLGTGKEIVSRFQTSIPSNRTFYTDSNGRQTVRRVRNVQRPWTKNITEPTSSNYYPVVSWIYLKSDVHNLQMTVFPDRPQGGTSLHNGEIELMLHRRLQYDDSFGVEEPLNEMGVDSEGLIAKGKHLVFLGSVAESQRKLRTVGNSLVYAPLYAFQDEPAEVPISTVSGLDCPLPANVHLLSLEPVREDQFILRLEHLYPGVLDEELRRPATVSLKHLFKAYVVTNVEETVLSANQFLRGSKRLRFDTLDSVSTSVPEVDMSGAATNGTGGGGDDGSAETDDIDSRLFTVTLRPADIRTFLVTVAPRYRFEPQFRRGRV
ncbi:lysosomal alpha-mannosidase [Ixodes scapularis]|uniref:lysosomal alpha-mannosidase n=1 Tax=Ixodes scapularis TaxID=6945 RepID=UPI001A9EEB6B|nr:lysosomal alpha-mannosidase [Ixodes scapularis]